ncbi:hypothetical protein Hte_012212 [Hypoxylon texense]
MMDPSKLSTDNTNRRRWENSRLNPQGGGASLRGDDADAEIHMTDRHKAMAHHVAAQARMSKAASITGSYQLSHQLNPSRPEFAPKEQAPGHVARTSTNNVGMASDLIMMATRGRPSRGTLSGPQKLPAYRQFNLEPIPADAQMESMLPLLFQQREATSTPSTVVAVSTECDQQQQKKQDPESRKYGGSRSTGSFVYPQDQLLPAGLRRRLTPIDSEKVADSRSVSPVSAGSSGDSAGQLSTQSEPLGPVQHETDGGMDQPQQETEEERASIDAANRHVRLLEANTEALLQESLRRRLLGNGGTAQYKQQPSSVGGMVQCQQYQQHQHQPGSMPQYHQQPGNIFTQQLAGPPPVGPIMLERVSDAVKKQRSAMLNQLTGEFGIPRLQDLLNPDNIPFVELASACEPNNHGVVKITNAPFTVTQAEVKAFMGRSSRILNDADEPVHIMMDRVTSKTYDIFVEFLTLGDAANAVAKHGDAAMRGRQPRLGHRYVDVNLSSQGELMSSLFPFAKGVNWYSHPYGITLYSNWSWENFDGFVSDEEMNMIWKHVESPGRTPYAADCKERIYECMISTLKKFPWYMSGFITIKQRQSIYNTTINMIRHLSEKIHEDPHHDRLTPQLFDRLVAAAMRCQGFTVLQKDNVAYIAELDEAKCLEFGLPRFSDQWRHQWGLKMKPGVPLDVVEYYICLIREETTRIGTHISISMPRRRELQNMLAETSAYWGYFWAEVAYPRGPAFDNMTIAEAAAREWNAIEQILRRAIAGGFVPQYAPQY